jgi:hypothetical protein
MQNLYLEVDDELEESQKLWRYMDLSKFVSLIETNALWMARVDTFRDQHEGRFPDDMRKIIEKLYEKFELPEVTVVKDADDFQDYLRKNTFISCWHKNFDENMVMWEIHGRDTNALAIQTTVDDMRNNINTSNLDGHSLKLKNVIYKNADEITEVLPYEECIFIKRPHFSFEQEVRISLDTYSPDKPTKKTPYGYYLPVFINGLIQQIVIHPDSQDWFLDVVKSITKKYKVHATILRGKCGTK